MRLLNMNDVRFLRHTKLAGKREIGRGAFASVFAEEHGDCVTKVTTDQMAYCLAADQRAQDALAPVSNHFPRVLEDYGDVGESRGARVYVLDMERLRPLSSSEHRRHVRKWVKAWDAFDKSVFGDCSYRSTRFCERMAYVNEPYAQVFKALANFFSDFGGALDLKLANFMERPSGELVFNDVVCDWQDYMRRTTVH